VEIKNIGRTSKETCALEVVHQVFGTFEVRRTNALTTNETLFVKGTYRPKNIYGVARIELNFAVIDLALLQETIAHELLHHVFSTKVEQLKEESIVTCVAPLLVHIVETSRQLATHILATDVKPNRNIDIPFL